ncbi:MAG: glycosyltransferase [Candidatus Omnitrophota bacterium]
MKIFIVHAPAGAGHKSAAFAIKDAFDKAKTGHDVRVIDSLEYTNWFFRKTYIWGYNFMVSKASFLWSFSYYLTDFKPIRPLVRSIRRMANFMNGYAFYKFVRKENPDCIVTTHFLSTEIISNLKLSKMYNGKLITVITDYGVHDFWISSQVDTYVVASEYTKKELASKGIPVERIRVLGIPVQEKFTRRWERDEAVRNLGLKEGLFTVLIIGGGLGVGPIPQMVQTISGTSEPFQLIVVCGKNESLRKHIEEIAKGSKTAMKLYGFADNVNELMDASDVMISKPGGLSISEAMVKGVPVIVNTFIPGQEENNLMFLEKAGVGVGTKTIPETLEKLEYLFRHKELLDAMRSKAKQLGKPSSAGDIVVLVLETIENK